MNSSREMNRSKVISRMNESKRKAKAGVSPWFWAWAALAAAIVGVKIMDNAPDRHGAPSDRIKSATVTPAEPSAESVEALCAKRAEEVQRECERQQRELEEQRFELEKEKLRADVAARVSKYRGDVNAIVEKYRRMLPLAAAEEAFARAKQGADFIASSDGLCGFKVCGKLAYKMAHDKIKGTHRTEDAINPIVSDRIVAPIEDAVKVYETWTVDFRRELQCEENAFALDLAVRSQKFKDAVSCFEVADSARVSAAVDKLVDDVKEHAKESACAAVGTVVELAMLKSSYAAIRAIAVRIAKMVLGGVAKKLATTASSAVISAAADGPLPVGDVVAAVITVCGFGWTAYDIHKASVSMPREMRERVMGAINETQAALRRSAVENLNADHDTCLRAAEVRARELEEMINK